MPELPEVETIRTSLEPVLIGKTIAYVEIREPKQFFGDPDKVIGSKIISLQRKGKYLSIVLRNVQTGHAPSLQYLNIHLKMSGQILFAAQKDNAYFNNDIPRSNSKQMPGKVTRIIITFNDNSALFYNDVRKFGWMKVTNKPEEPKGIDILSPDFTFEYFLPIVKKPSKPIKHVLLDQDVIAGIGNIYANDALWEAKIYPLRKSNSLTTDEIRYLYEAVKKIISEGVRYHGSSAADENYILPDSSRGQYQHHFRVYHREGKPCLRCGTSIKRIKYSGRSSFFCPTCQSFT